MILRSLLRRLLVRRNHLQGEMSRGRYTNELLAYNAGEFLGWRELLVDVHIVIAVIFDFITEITTLGESPNPSIFFWNSIWRFQSGGYASEQKHS